MKTKTRSRFVRGLGALMGAVALAAAMPVGEASADRRHSRHERGDHRGHERGDHRGCSHGDHRGRGHGEWYRHGGRQHGDHGRHYGWNRGNGHRRYDARGQDHGHYRYYRPARYFWGPFGF